VSGIDLWDIARYLRRHPSKVPVVIRAGWRLRARQWWRRAPFLPVPSEAYWNFRMVTALGSTSAVLSGREVVEAATWSLHQRVER
jgi:hypothetical protein